MSPNPEVTESMFSQESLTTAAQGAPLGNTISWVDPEFANVENDAVDG